MAAYSSVLAWRIPRTGEPGGLASMGSHRVGHDWSDLAAAAAANGYHSSFKKGLHTTKCNVNKSNHTFLLVLLTPSLLWKGKWGSVWEVLRTHQHPRELEREKLLLCGQCFSFSFNWNIADLQCCADFCLQWSDSVIRILNIYSQDVEYSSLWSTVGACGSSISHIIVCIC